MDPLPGPLELLDLPDTGELVTRVTKWELGEATIRPASAPQGKTVKVLRMHVPLEDKQMTPAWWDVTATTLIPSLVTQLPAAIAGGRYIRIRKFGVAPRARFAFELYPAGQGGPAFVGVRR